MSQPRGIDLVAFSDSLTDEHKRLRGLIRDVRDTHSAYSDLRVAADLAGRAIDLANVAGQLPPQLVEDHTLALLSTAIITYSRATSTTSDHRKTFDLRSRFDENELRDHNLICKLRDDGFAHYGPGGLELGTAIRDDRLILPAGDQHVIFASKHFVRSNSLAHVVRRQAQRAALLTLRSVRDRESAMVQALNAETAKDPSFATMARNFEVNLAEVFGSLELANRILAGPRVGSPRYSGCD